MNSIIYGRQSLIFVALTLALISSILSSCGGLDLDGNGSGSGSGDSDSLLAGIASVQAAPRDIDTGERTLIRITINEAHQDGVIVKTRYPQGLNFFRKSAIISADGSTTSLEPIFQGSSKVANEKLDYLVFFLPRTRFGLTGTGDVSFQLVGRSAVATGDVEVDLDLNNTLSGKFQDFSPTDPRFSTEASVTVKVAG
jgi:hypothetical protein